MDKDAYGSLIALIAYIIKNADYQTGLNARVSLMGALTDYSFSYRGDLTQEKVNLYDKDQYQITHQHNGITKDNNLVVFDLLYRGKTDITISVTATEDLDFFGGTYDDGKVKVDGTISGTIVTVRDQSDDYEATDYRIDA